MAEGYEQNEEKPIEENGGGKGGNGGFLTRATLEKVSDWTFENLPAVISIAIAALLPYVVGFAAALAVYALIMYYKNGGKEKNEQD